MPPGLVEDEYGVGAGRDLGSNFGEMQAHRLGIAARQDKSRAFAVPGADGAEDIGRGGALVVRRTGPRATFGPASGDLVLLPDAGFVGKPDFYRGRIDALVARDLFQARGETFLKSSMAPWACA
jgi:hypothetical protein